MKTLIIYTNFGNGHKSAAYNIASNLEGEVFLHNTRRESSPKMTRFIEYLYEEFFLKNSKNKIVSSFYGFLYKLVNKSQLLLDLFVINTSNKRVNFLIKKYNPDLVIVTFPQKIKKDIPVLVTLTDYSFDNCWFLKESDFYTVNDQISKDDLVKRGAKKENVFITGIPIKSEYDMENDKKTIKNILFNLGAKGYCDYDVLVKNINKLLKNNFNVEVMCGNNFKLFNSLNEIFKNKIIVYSFINNVQEVLQKSDLVITKAGGLSLTECIYSKRPVIINSTQSLSGQEEGNLNFVINNQIGKVSKDKDIADVIIDLDDKQYLNFVNNMEKIKKNYKNLAIIDIVKEINKNGK